MSARSCLFFVVALGLFLPMSVHALPWDMDMYRQQSHQANEMARAPVKGTVPVGYRPYTDTPETAARRKNPVKLSLDSVWRGKRLWKVNCVACHGRKGDGKGPVGPLMNVPSLLTDYYAGKPDGSVYYVINKGGASMPRYGFKFSPTEHWDLVNYLKFLQGKDVAGMKRPK